ncbi:hypothetical protein E1B28_006532 [Marasmius oreades]|uniref:BTB domain-containing protein n=1 Tax=Marasmius oreades TaxID=181124 RepID=A0A9P7UVD7_9AGAR|nr:uncharacterized protein E1B28_006532 [Marasmius oreades]KAG7095837.1 hypothetical protein E1B28_006532 [Marasmius oreades]
MELGGAPRSPSPSAPSIHSKLKFDCDLDVDKASLTTPETLPVHDRHSTYYIDEQMSIFLVENCLFRVHRHFLRNESVVFDSMFSCPPPAYGEEGQSDENPIVLPSVTRNEFVALMDYFYKGTFFKSQPGHSTSLQEYIDLLSISTRYECAGARDKAIRGIDKFPPNPIRNLVLSEKYSVPQWFMPAYIELCKREKPLKKDEAICIGLEKTLLIAEARENLRSSAESRQMLVSSGHWDKWPPSMFDNSRVERYIGDAANSICDIQARKKVPKKGGKIST